MCVYRFVGDSGPGDVTRQGVNAFGGLWHAVAASGKAVVKAPDTNTEPAPPQTTYPGY